MHRDGRRGEDDVQERHDRAGHVVDDETRRATMLTKELDPAQREPEVGGGDVCGVAVDVDGTKRSDEGVDRRVDRGGAWRREVALGTAADDDDARPRFVVHGHVLPLVEPHGGRGLAMAKWLA